MSASRTEFDAIIVGAGVVGSVAAASLLSMDAPAGRVALIAERMPAQPKPEADWDLRVFALSRASERLLERCGIWTHLPSERRFAYERMRVWDASGTAQGSGSLAFDCAEIGEPNLGYIVDGAQLQWQCFARARQMGALCVESALSRLSEQAGQQVLHLADGRQLKTRLLIGADGVDSAVRRHLEIQTAGHSYGQKALVAHLSTERGHANTAWQRFLSSGPLAFLPLSDGRSSIVWSIDEARAAELLRMDQDGFAKAVSEASDKVLGECRLTSNLASFPLHLKYALEYARPGAVLLGDAAHAVHPLAGQGLNLGLEDVATLIEVLAAVSEEQWGDLRTLRRYERRRKSDNALAMIGLDGLERLFGNADGFTTALRRVGLGAVERLPLLKRRLAMTALGL